VIAGLNWSNRQPTSVPKATPNPILVLPKERRLSKGRTRTRIAIQMMTITMIFKLSPPPSSSPIYALSFLYLPSKKHDRKPFNETLVVPLVTELKVHMAFGQRTRIPSKRLSSYGFTSVLRQDLSNSVYR